MQMDAATFGHPGVPAAHAFRTHCNYPFVARKIAPAKWTVMRAGLSRDGSRSDLGGRNVNATTKKAPRRGLFRSKVEPLGPIAGRTRPSPELRRREASAPF